MSSFSQIYRLITWVSYCLLFYKNDAVYWLGHVMLVCLLFFFLFTNLVHRTYMPIENHLGLMSLQTIPRMWTQSSWRQKESASSCLFSQPSMKWQETEVHSTLRQRDLYVWKGQRNLKGYPNHMPLLKKVLDFPCGCSVRPEDALQKSQLIPPTLALF